MVDDTLSHFVPGDYILLQNEISCVDYAIRSAKKRGVLVAFNPSPVSEELLTYPLDMVDVLILNELEGRTLSGSEDAEVTKIMIALASRFPRTAIVLTLGEKGALYHDQQIDLFCPAYKVPVVDTTGAGDTFCGYFLACTMKGMDPQKSLETATRASALSIGKKGAAVSIPTLAQVESSDFIISESLPST